MATAGEEASHEESNENQAHPEGTRAEIYVFLILVFKEGFFSLLCGSSLPQLRILQRVCVRPFNDLSSSTFDLLTVFVCNGIQGVTLLALRQLMLMRKCLKRKKMERLQLVKRILLILLKMKLSMNRNLNTGKLSRKIRRTSLAGHISYSLWSKRYVLNTSTFALILITWKKQLLLNFISSCFT